jgi:hypothetical protein
MTNNEKDKRTGSSAGRNSEEHQQRNQEGVVFFQKGSSAVAPGLLPEVKAGETVRLTSVLIWQDHAMTDDSRV